MGGTRCTNGIPVENCFTVIFIALISLFFFFSTDSNWQSVAAFLQNRRDFECYSKISFWSHSKKKDHVDRAFSLVDHSGHASFTIYDLALRCGAQYSLRENNFYEALVGNKYIEFTKYALERFLNGYTAYTGRKRGWVRQFNENNQGFSVDMVDSLLVKPLRK